MKTWIVGVLIGWLKRLGHDFLGDRANLEARVKECVDVLVQLQKEHADAKARAGAAEQRLQEGRITLNLSARLTLAARREALQGLMQQVEASAAVLDMIDEAWLQAVNAASYPQVQDRERSWYLGAASYLMELKSALLAAQPKADDAKRG